MIVNEFGDIGIDREILRGCGIESCGDDDVVELANGCICCTVADDFLPTLRKLIERPNPPEHILIETSGLVPPKPLVKAFTWPEVRTRATVDSVVALIDADAVAKGRAFIEDAAARDFLAAANPEASHDIAERLRDAIARGFWTPRSNSAGQDLEALSAREAA